jgi:putative transposase
MSPQLTPVQITRTYKVKLHLSRSAHQRLEGELRSQGRLYNAALEHRRWAYKMGGHSITYAQQSRELTQVRADDPEMAAVHRTIQVATLRRIDRAFQGFFRRVRNGERPGFPRFKPASRFRTLVCDNNIQARSMVKIREGGKGVVRIKGLAAMHFKSDRVLPPISNLMELRITRTPRRVEAHLVFTTQTEVPLPPAEPTRAIGLDMGVHSQVTYSDGRQILGYGRRRYRIKRLQRRVSRAQRGSNRRRKKVAALAKEHDRETARRKGWTHELSADIVKNHDFIAAEHLSIGRMLEERTQELPREVEKRVNEGIADQAWGDLLAKIAYKAESAGVRFVQVDPRNTTVACSGCGTMAPKAISERLHRCPHCRLVLVKGHNSAINVLRLGLAQAAGGSHPGTQGGRLSTAPVGAGLRRKPP